MFPLLLRQITLLLVLLILLSTAVCQALGKPLIYTVSCSLHTSMSYCLTMWIRKPRFNYRLSDLHEVTKGGLRVRGGAKIWPESIDSESISQGHYNFNSLLVVVQSLNRA